MMRTAVIATKLGFVSFIVPYLFVYNTALLGLGSASAVVWTFTTGILGVVTMAIAFQGYLFEKLRFHVRIAMALVGMAILHHSIPLNAVAIVMAVVLVLSLKRREVKRLHPAATPGNH